MNTLRSRTFFFVFVSLAALTILVLLTTGRSGVFNKSSDVLSVRTAAGHNLIDLPAGLMPAVAQTLASQSPSIWTAHVASNKMEVFNNPVQHFTASFGSNGARLQLGKHENAGITMRLIAYRNENVTQPVTTRTISANGNRVEMFHNHRLTEWYENSPLGMEQGFTVAAPLKSTALGHNIELIFNLSGDLTPVQTGDSIEFRNAAGRSILRYGELLAWDAHHRLLPAKLQLEDKKLILRINAIHGSYPITIDPMFSAVETFTDPQANAADYFGGSVALSADGNTALVGANGTGGSGSSNYGRAYLFIRTNGVWSSTPAQTFTDPAHTGNDLFGESVTLSGDGGTALVGAPGAVVSGNVGAGAAYMYIVRNGIWPSTPSYNFVSPDPTSVSGFGFSVALSGSAGTALIGADSATVSGQSNAGAAYVFNESGGIWSATPTQSFFDPLGVANDEFGSQVALSNDGTGAIIGAPGVNNSAGAAYAYIQSGGVWSNTPAQRFSDPAATAGDDFGGSIALSGDGATALIGAPDTAVSVYLNIGMAYLYTRVNGLWSSTPAHEFSGSKDLSEGRFGTSVSLSGDGSITLISACAKLPCESTEGGGLVYIFEQSNGAWSNTPNYVSADPRSNAYDFFGYSTALSADGSSALVGAPGGTVLGKSYLGAAYFLAPSADLSLALSSNPASMTVGQNVTYMFTVSNNDTQVTATNLILTDTLPSGINYVSANAAGGTCNNANGIVTCTLASLAPQATWQPSLTVTAESAGSITDSANVNASQVDPNTSNNSASVTTTVSAVTPPSSGGGSGGGGGAFGLFSLLLLVPFLLRRKMYG